MMMLMRKKGFLNEELEEGFPGRGRVPISDIIGCLSRGRHGIESMASSSSRGSSRGGGGHLF